jgi:hypothetical protein
MTLQRPGKSGVREVVGTWGGIPLRWATTLFSGRLPCPALSPDWSVAWEKDSVLVARRTRGEAVGEWFRFQIKSWGGRPWVEVLEWSAGEGPRARPPAAGVSALRIELRDPDLKTGRAKRWEAKSSQGEVTIRWKDREGSGPSSKKL